MENEWLIFTVVVAIVSAFLLVYTPLRNASKERENQRLQQEKESAAARENNTKAITKLNTSLDLFMQNFTKMQDDNHDSHQRIYERLEEKGKILSRHEEKLKEHDRRLEMIEKGE